MNQVKVSKIAKRLRSMLRFSGVLALVFAFLTMPSQAMLALAASSMPPGGLESTDLASITTLPADAEGSQTVVQEAELDLADRDTSEEGDPEEDGDDDTQASIDGSDETIDHEIESRIPFVLLSESLHVVESRLIGIYKGEPFPPPQPTHQI